MSFMNYDNFIEKSNELPISSAHMFSKSNLEYDKNLNSYHDHLDEDYQEKLATKYPGRKYNKNGLIPKKQKIEKFTQMKVSSENTMFMIGSLMLLATILFYLYGNKTHRHMSILFFVISLYFLNMAVSTKFENLPKNKTINKKVNFTKWKHNNAAKCLSTSIEKLGKPTFIETKSGGYALWKSPSDSMFKMHLIKDNTNGCIRSTIYFKVSPERTKDIREFSNKISYNNESNMLSACDKSIEKNLVTLALATQISNKNLSLKYINTNDIYEKWLSNTDQNKSRKLLQYNITNNVVSTPKPYGI